MVGTTVSTFRGQEGLDPHVQYMPTAGTAVTHVTIEAAVTIVMRLNAADVGREFWVSGPDEKGKVRIMTTSIDGLDTVVFVDIKGLTAWDYRHNINGVAIRNSGVIIHDGQ